MKRTVIAAALIFLFAQISCGQWTSIGNVDKFEKEKNGISLQSGTARINISVLSPVVINVSFSPEGVSYPEHSWAVVARDLGDKSFTVKETPGQIFLMTSKITVKIQRSPCRITFLDDAGNMINEDEIRNGMAWSGSDVRVSKTMPRDEYYFGLGEKAGGIERKWKTYSMWNSDIPGYKADTDPLYQSIPFFYAIRKGKSYGIFLDNTSYTNFNFGKENRNVYSFGAVNGYINYYFIYGPDPKDVSAGFSKITGQMPLPPLWSVGYQQCRYSYYPESRVREIAQTFRSKKIPCDVIYLDIHYMDEYRCFTWDKRRFPDPQRMVSDLRSDGFKVVTIIDPGIKNEPGYWVYDSGLKGNHFVKYPDGKNFIGKVWPGDCVFPDFTSDYTRKWWGNLYEDFVKIGIAGFWNDMNEPAVFDGPDKTFDLSVMHDGDGYSANHAEYHNIYGMQMARATYEGVMGLRPTERPFVLTRASYAGGNRYAAAWTGDNISSWEHLEMAVPMCLGLSISGQPFVGTDIGGFIGSPNGELFTRWLQFGIFSPLMRTHTEINSNDQEPWSYGPEFEAINKKSIELRYKLLPYIYTQFYKASLDGTPIMRPLFLDYPGDTESYWRGHEFMFGDAFLVVPVVKEGETRRGFRLPEGKWYDYWTDMELNGPQYLVVDAPIDRIPLFVKSGAIIPTQPVLQYTGERPVEEITFEIYPPSMDSSASAFYEDDGISFGYREGKFLKRQVICRQTSSSISVSLSAAEGSYHPLNRGLVFNIHNVAERPKNPASSTALITSWSYDEKTKIFTVKLPDKLDYFDFRFGK